MNRRTLPVLAALMAASLIAGCAGSRERSAASAPEEVSPPPADHRDTATLRLPGIELVPKPPAPSRGLDQEALYRLLVADMAARRGDSRTALQHYLEVARTQSDPRLAKRATRLALHVGDAEAALAATRRWVELAPDSREAHELLVRLWLRQGDSERALQAMRRVIALSEGGPESGLRRVASLVEGTASATAARTALGELAEDHPDSRAVHYAIANLSAQAGDPEAALAALERALAIDPDYTDALVLRANIHIEQGRVEQGLDQLAAAYRKRPANRDLALSYVRQLLAAERTEQAKKEMQQIHERFGEDPALVRSLALLALEANLLEHATLYLERLVNMNARTSMAHYYLGRIAQQKGDCGRALQQYVKVMQGEHRFDAKLRAALCMAALGRIDEARLHLERMQGRHDSDEALARIALTHAQVEREAGNLERALQVLDSMLESQPDNVDLLYARALTAAEADRFERARADLGRILELDPDNAAALNALGYMLADRGVELKRAQSLIERALAQQPNDAAILDSMGWVLFRQGETREALTYLRRAYDINPDPEIAAHLGEVLWTLDRHAEAREIWQRAREQGPNNELLEHTTRRLQP